MPKYTKIFLRGALKYIPKTSVESFKSFLKHTPQKLDHFWGEEDGFYPALLSPDVCSRQK